MRDTKVRRRKGAVGGAFQTTGQGIKNPEPQPKPLVMIDVDSSNIAAIGYRKNEYYDNGEDLYKGKALTGTLYIRFKSGITYKYEGFPGEEYRKLMEADSKGSYFYHKIRQQYKGIVVDVRATYV